MKLKRFENIDIDPFEEEDWDEGESQFFTDDETGLELEWSPTKETMDGWTVRDIVGDKMEKYIQKIFNRLITDDREIMLCTSYVVRDKIEEYKKKLK